MKNKVSAEAFMGAMSPRKAPVDEGSDSSELSSAKKKKPTGLHVGAYFDPIVVRQLKEIMAEENTTLQSLVGQAINMLFHAKGKPPIARED